LDPGTVKHAGLVKFILWSELFASGCSDREREKQRERVDGVNSAGRKSGPLGGLWTDGRLIVTDERWSIWRQRRLAGGGRAVLVRVNPGLIREVSRWRWWANNESSEVCGIIKPGQRVKLKR